MNILTGCLLALLILASETAKAQSFDPLCTGTAIGALIGTILNPRANVNELINKNCGRTPPDSTPSSAPVYSSDDTIRRQMLRQQQIERNADINNDSIRDSNCLASSSGCTFIEVR
ncbi:MAG: hypothetical protein ACO3B3_00790 [Cyanobium sp.]